MSAVYLITGGAGNLACQLTHKLARRAADITLFDIAEKPIAKTADGCRYVQGDITQVDTVSSVIRQCRPDVIVHLASLLSGSSEQQRDMAWRVNMDGTFHLFQQAVECGVQQVFFPSSVAAYGGTLPNPVPEDFPQWPTGLYGVTKAAIERLGVYYATRHDLDFRSIRLPVVVSEFAPAHAASAYVSQAFVRSVREGHYTFAVRPMSRPSLIYVNDVLRAIVDLLEVDAQRLSRCVYNLQAMSPTAEEVVAAISKRIPDVSLAFKTDPKVANLIDSWPVAFDDQSARADWNWQPQYDLEHLADDFIEHLRSTASNARQL